MRIDNQPPVAVFTYRAVARKSAQLFAERYVVSWDESLLVHYTCTEQLQCLMGPLVLHWYLIVAMLDLSCHSVLCVLLLYCAENDAQTSCSRRCATVAHASAQNDTQNHTKTKSLDLPPSPRARDGPIPCEAQLALVAAALPPSLSALLLRFLPLLCLPLPILSLASWAFPLDCFTSSVQKHTYV